ncbi:MAG: cyclopropane fatty acyl phospholipid synthase [candidate division Zixibacteria bacterium]|nr:cyclopropane fatty acyl phospholipid synthase [candidate division Zixibacteria bacterium]
MRASRLEAAVRKLLEHTDIRINGNNRWDIQVHDNRFYKRAVGEAELGLGESYMDGWWDCEEIDTLICKLLRSGLQDVVRRNWSILWPIALAAVFNRQKKRRAQKDVGGHYSLGNDLFQKMLDPLMLYTCGYWNNAASLEQAQINKLELICRKLELKPGMRVLDIGCGWGGFGKYAAENHGVSVVGVTVSKEQMALGQELCQGLPVEFRLSDFRQLNERFDRVVAIGMIEHIGYKNYRTFMKVVHRCLDDDGLFLLHTIGEIRSVTVTDPWTEKYIFPGSMLPSTKQLGQATENLFVMEDWHNFGADYDKTLMAWYANFERSWDSIKQNYDDRFFRMWKYFLLSTAGSFRARRNQLWQIVFSKRGVIGGYQSYRL